MSDFSKPIPLDKLRLVFPGDVSDLLPPMEAIPARFKSGKDNSWLRFQRDWFYRGLEDCAFEIRDGIDPTVAFRHLQAIQVSYEPQHEHKAAGVAYLASLWFEDIEYTIRAVGA